MSASCAWLDIRPVLSERSPASAGVLVHRLPDTSLAARLRARARPLCRLDVSLADKRAKWRIDQPCEFLSSLKGRRIPPRFIWGKGGPNRLFRKARTFVTRGGMDPHH